MTAVAGRSTAGTEKVAETDFLGAAADKGLDDWEVSDNDGDECFATGPFATRDCAVRSGLRWAC